MMTENVMVKESNDNELRRVIFERDKVIVKFTDKDCPVCKVMRPKYNMLSDEPAFKDIYFMRMSAHENPVSSQEVKLTGTPFFATYHKGMLIDCGILSTEEGLREMLQKLLLLS